MFQNTTIDFLWKIENFVNSKVEIENFAKFVGNAFDADFFSVKLQDLDLKFLQNFYLIAHTFSLIL